MRTTKKTRLTLIAAGTGAVALAVAGAALPAAADDWSNEESSSTSTTDLTSSFDAFQTWVSDAIEASGNQVATGVSPDTAVGDVTLVEGPLVSDSLNGDVLSGNQTPVASGNDVPVASGNDVAAPVLSGNDTDVSAPIEAPVDAPVGSGNDVSAPIDAPVASGNESHSDTDTDLSVGDIGADVDDLVDSAVGDLDLGGLLD